MTTTAHELAALLARDSFPGPQHHDLRQAIRRHADRPHAVRRLAQLPGIDPAVRARVVEIADVLDATFSERTVVCHECGMVFTPVDDGDRWCSEECRCYARA